MTEQDITVAKLMEAASEYWVVLGHGAFAWRHGPFQREEVGPILQRAIDEGVAITVVSQLGKEIDWDFFKEFCPCTYSKKQEDDAPDEGDGREQLSSCEGCKKPIYEGDKYFPYRDGPDMCEECAPTVSECIAHFEELLAIDDLCDEDRAEYTQSLESMKARLAEDGDSKVTTSL